jgi:hypothetical protein
MAAGVLEAFAHNYLKQMQIKVEEDDRNSCFSSRLLKLEETSKFH